MTGASCQRRRRRRNHHLPRPAHSHLRALFVGIYYVKMTVHKAGTSITLVDGGVGAGDTTRGRTPIISCIMANGGELMRKFTDIILVPLVNSTNK